MREPGKKKIKLTFVYYIGIAYFVLFMFFFSERSIYKLVKLKWQNKVLENKISARIKENDDLEKKTQLLQNDAGEIEKVARERLGMIKKGEEVIKFVEKTEESEK